MADSAAEATLASRMRESIYFEELTNLRDPYEKPLSPHNTYNCTKCKRDFYCLVMERVGLDPVPPMCWICRSRQPG